MANGNQRPPELGDLVKDKITPMKGILVSVTHNLGGSSIAQVQPNETKDDGTIATQTIEYDRLYVLTRNAYGSRPGEG